MIILLCSGPGPPKTINFHHIEINGCIDPSHIRTSTKTVVSEMIGVIWLNTFCGFKILCFLVSSYANSILMYQIRTLVFLGLRRVYHTTPPPRPPGETLAARGPSKDSYATGQNRSSFHSPRSGSHCKVSWNSSIFLMKFANNHTCFMRLCLEHLKHTVFSGNLFNKALTI